MILISRTVACDNDLISLSRCCYSLCYIDHCSSGMRGGNDICLVMKILIRNGQVIKKILRFKGFFN